MNHLKAKVSFFDVKLIVFIIVPFIIFFLVHYFIYLPNQQIAICHINCEVDDNENINHIASPASQIILL